MPPAITRDQERRLYDYLREVTEGDALRYQLIAKKIHHAADGTAIEWELAIVRDWLNAMVEESTLKAAAEEARLAPDSTEAPFEGVRRGEAGNPNYQAFLDTLEQVELDAITNNVPYFAWFSARKANVQNGEVFSPEYLRSWADKHLSERVKALRALT